MSRDYHNICNKITQSNNELYQRDIMIKEITQIKQDLNKLSIKIDKLYNIIVNMINGGEY